MRSLKENLPREEAQKLSLSEQKENQLTASFKEQKKSITDSAELLRDLMIGIENLGENVKDIQKEMDY